MNKTTLIILLAALILVQGELLFFVVLDSRLHQNNLNLWSTQIDLNDKIIRGMGTTTP